MATTSEKRMVALCGLVGYLDEGVELFVSGGMLEEKGLMRCDFGFWNNS
jgi:hypothetical protein